MRWEEEEHRWNRIEVLTRGTHLGFMLTRLSRQIKPGSIPPKYLVVYLERCHISGFQFKDDFVTQRQDGAQVYFFHNVKSIPAQLKQNNKRSYKIIYFEQTIKNRDLRKCIIKV